MSIPLIIILVIVVVLVVAVIGLYNNLVKLRNMVDNAWAQIDVQLQRRLDLIPNLVETVKGYAAHESGTLEEVTKARTAVMNAPTPEGKMQADGFLTGALKEPVCRRGGIPRPQGEHELPAASSRAVQH